MAETSIFNDSFQVLQIIGLLISLFLIGKAITDYKRERIGKGAFLFWITIWGVALLAFIIPKAPQALLSLLEVGDVFIIALIITNVILFILVYVLFTNVYSLNNKIKSLVQKLALKEKISGEDNEDD
ncbi:DUF2304 domain-containing protein [Nitrosopumilus sp. K4]|uniref:DUF2304 domain-containing protein n=1 Tax=Nitrosopumilus sp. K4 TaxID=2795383 RepID=UPI001BA6B71D|nr:DUF2304 domain-containing protein [Nitrosopumilus sp. K4]QUC64516.1 DUF2304 domain-containing protein [Nitrosopumilus sp. K4]